MNKNILVSMIIFSDKLDADIENKLKEEYRSLYKSFLQLVEVIPNHDSKQALSQLLEMHPDFIGTYKIAFDDIFEMPKIIGNYNGTEYHAIFSSAYGREFEDLFDDHLDLINNIFGGSIWDIVR